MFDYLRETSKTMFNSGICDAKDRTWSLRLAELSPQLSDSLKQFDFKKRFIYVLMRGEEKEPEDNTCTCNARKSGPHA